MSLILTYNGKFSYSGNGVVNDPYYFAGYYTNFQPDIQDETIFLTSNSAGTINIEYNHLQGDIFFNPIHPRFRENTARDYFIFPNQLFQYAVSNATTITRFYIPDYTFAGFFPSSIYGLKIWFVPNNNITSTTTSTTTQQPIGSKVFIHVGDINIPDNNCGRYKLTLDGAQSNYFSIYGKRVYLTTYPSNTGTYSVNVCAKDIANRFTPVCDTFDLTIKKCVFTTEPPTTTAAPNFGYVQSDNSVSPVNQYTYNKIYGMKKI